MTPDQSPPLPAGPPPTFLDAAADQAAEAAAHLLGFVPELRGVAVVFDWGVPVTAEVVPGLAFARGPEPGGPPAAPGPVELLGLQQQLVRMTARLATAFQGMLVAADGTARSLARTIHERQTALDGVNARLAAAEAEGRPAAG